MTMQHAEPLTTTETDHRERRRAHLRLARRALAVLLLAALTAGAVYLLWPKPILVDRASASRGSLSVTVEENGMTRVKDRYLISAPVTGNVSRLILEPGDAISENGTVAEIAPADSPLLDARTRAQSEARLSAALSNLGLAKAQSERASTAKENSERELERTRALAQHGSTSRQALDQAEFDARMRAQELASAVFAGKVAEEEVRIARIVLKGDAGGSGRDRHLAVVAPVTGQVLRVYQKSAGLVQAGAPLLEIGDPAALEIVVDLLTTDAVHVHPGSEAIVNGWGGDHPLLARVRRVEPSAFTRPSALGVDEQRVNVILVLSEPREKWAELGDGYRVEIRFVLWQSDDVLKVPLGAVFRSGEQWAVFRDDQGTARLTPVEVDHRGETEVEVLSGLHASDAVLVHPGDNVKDGVAVRGR